MFRRDHQIRYSHALHEDAGEGVRAFLGHTGLPGRDQPAAALSPGKAP